MVKNNVRVGTWTTLGQAAAGVYGQERQSANSTSSISGCRGELENHFHELLDGGTAIDKRPAFARDSKAATSAIFKGPMLNPWLESGMVDSFIRGGKIPAMGIDLRGFDNVALDVYCDYWRPLGARIGKRDGANIVWEDGTIEPIIVPDWYRG